MGKILQVYNILKYMYFLNEQKFLYYGSIWIS